MEWEHQRSHHEHQSSVHCEKGCEREAEKKQGRGLRSASIWRSWCKKVQFPAKDSQLIVLFHLVNHVQRKWTTYCWTLSYYIPGLLHLCRKGLWPQLDLALSNSSQSSVSCTRYFSLGYTDPDGKPLYTHGGLQFSFNITIYFLN